MENKLSRKQQFLHLIMLIFTAFLWGSTFVAQSIGADHIGAFGFLACRSWVAMIVLIPTALVIDRIKVKNGGEAGRPVAAKDKRALALGGLACGFFLFMGSLTQQIGIASTTTAKSGFITAMYIVIVPVIMVFIERKMHIKVWVCVALGVVGLYLLSYKTNEPLNPGDLITLLCAVFFSLQIIMVDRFVGRVDPVWLSLSQFGFTTVAATIFSFIFEKNTLEMVISAAPAILYAGILSSGVAFTLQIVAQKNMNPTVASLVMSLESVFGALSGWVVLGQTLTFREFCGCVIMFSAIIISQISLPKRKKSIAFDNQQEMDYN